MASAEDFKIRCRRNPRGRARAGQDERPALEDQIEATTNRPRTENLNIGNICSSRKTFKNDQGLKIHMEMMAYALINSATDTTPKEAQ